MTMPWPITQPINNIDPGLFPFKVAADVVFRQYMPKIPLINLMGKEPTRPIVTRTVKKGDGSQYRVPQLQAIDYTNPVTDYNQIRGQAQTPSTVYDYVNIGQVSFPCKLDNEQLTSFLTPIDLQNYIVDEITDACALNLNKSILDAATFGNYPDTATMKPSYDRIVLAGGTAAAVTRTAYNAYNGLQGALQAAMTAGPAFNQNGLSTTALTQAINMAALGGNLNGVVYSQGVTIENIIRPSKLMTQSGWAMDKYIGFFNPIALTSLYNDTLFQSTGTTRGTVVSDSQPEMISGADYVGEWGGVYIHKVNDLSRYTVLANNQTYAWGFLIGAAAWSLGWAEYANIVSDPDNIERSMLWTSHEIRGQKCLKFPAKQPTSVGAGTTTVEQGIIHIFTRIS
jgi:hypothetical protein